MLLPCTLLASMGSYPSPPIRERHTNQHRYQLVQALTIVLCELIPMLIHYGDRLKRKVRK